MARPPRKLALPGPRSGRTAAASWGKDQGGTSMWRRLCSGHKYSGSVLLTGAGCKRAHDRRECTKPRFGCSALRAANHTRHFSSPLSHAGSPSATLESDHKDKDLAFADHSYINSIAAPLPLQPLLRPHTHPHTPQKDRRSVPSTSVRSST